MEAKNINSVSISENGKSTWIHAKWISTAQNLPAACFKIPQRIM
jgi:hypothetical protein